MITLSFLTTERDWPWRDGDWLGWQGLVIVGALLILLTLWTYLGHRKVGWRRLLVILGLRLGALAVTALLILRPTFASEEEIITSGKLLVVLDYSSSMQILDGPNSSSRWDVVRQLFEWPDVKEALTQLQRQKQLELVLYQGAEDAHRYDPSSPADGRRTDIGQWLHTLNGLHRSDKNLRGLLIFSDGQDNGTRFLAVDEAAQFRGLSCPVHTFVAGLEATSKGQKDIAVVNIKTDKDTSPYIYVGNEINVKAEIDAPLLEGQKVTMRLLVDGKEVSAKSADLPATRGNVVDAGKIIPDRVGELRITVKVDEVPGEFTTLNNELSTYINVEKKGINVLWVDARWRQESTWIIRHVLSKKDSRFNVVHLTRPQDVPFTAAEMALFLDPSKAFDVVVIGDISAALFSGHDSATLAALRDRIVSKRTGLLLLGAARALADDWPSTGKAIADLLPVDIANAGEIQEDLKIRALPDAANQGHRLLDLPGGKDLWIDDAQGFRELRGMSKLGKVRPGADVLLRADNAANGEPLFVLGGEDGSRVAVFAGANTSQAWYANEKAVEAYERFWNGLFGWLARQEKGDNRVWLKLDRRRLPAGAKQRLGFSVGLVGEDGREVKNPIFTVTVTGPSGDKVEIKPRLKVGEYRGEFDQANAVGEYKVEVTQAVGIDASGKEIKAGNVSAHFMAFSEDVENQRPSANPKFLARLAEAGGGTFRIAGKEELLQYLSELREHTSALGWTKRDVWPNWRYQPATDALPDQMTAMVASGALPCLALFVVIVSAEWFLRRWWGLV
jgi:hypothetical protein